MGFNSRVKIYSLFLLSIILFYWFTLNKIRKTHTFFFTSFHILLFFEHFVKDFEDLDLQECGDVNMTDAWLSQVCIERNNCFGDQRKANKVIIKRYTKKNRLAENNIR